MKKFIIVLVTLLGCISAVKAQDEDRLSDDTIMARDKRRYSKAEFVFEGRMLYDYVYWDKVARRRCWSAKIEIHRIIKGEQALKHGSIEVFSFLAENDSLSTEFEIRSYSNSLPEVYFCTVAKDKRKSLPTTMDTVYFDNTIQVKILRSNHFVLTENYETQWDSIQWNGCWGGNLATKEVYKQLGLKPSWKETFYAKRMDRKWLRRFEREEGLDTSGAFKRKKRADSIAVEMKTFVQNHAQKAKRSANNVALRFRINDRWRSFEGNKAEVSLSSSAPTYLDKTIILLHYEHSFYRNVVQKNKFKIELLNELLDKDNYCYSLIPSDYDENTIMLTLTYKGGKHIRLDNSYKALFRINLFCKYIYEFKQFITLTEKSITSKSSFYTLSDTVSNQSMENIFNYFNIEGIDTGKKRGTTTTDTTGINSIEYYNGRGDVMHYGRAGCEDYILIRGRGFGPNKGIINFPDCNAYNINTTNTFICKDRDIEEWTNTQIRVHPPTFLLSPERKEDFNSFVAGSGKLFITVGTKRYYSPSNLLIYAAFMNEQVNGNKARKLLKRKDLVSIPNNPSKKVFYEPSSSDKMSGDMKTIIRVAFDALSCRLPIEISFFDKDPNLSGVKKVGLSNQMDEDAMMKGADGIEINKLRELEWNLSMPYETVGTKSDFYYYFIHEVAHILGLWHVYTKNNIMYPKAGRVEGRMSILDNVEGTTFFLDQIKETVILSSTQAIATDRITLKTQPSTTCADFSIPPVGGTMLAFRDQTPDAREYFWEFGDKKKETSIIVDPEHNYTKNNPIIYHSAKGAGGYCYCKPVYKQITLSDKCSFDILQVPKNKESCIALVGLKNEKGFAAKYEWVITASKKDTLTIEKVVQGYSSPIKSIRITGTTGRTYGLYLRAYKDTADKSPSFVSNVVELDFVSATCGNQLQTELYIESFKN